MDVAIPSLKVIGNGLSGCDGDADTVMAAGVLDTLLAILRGGGDDSLAKEAAWALSNIAAGTEQQLQAMLEKPGLIRQLVAILRSAEHAVATKKECAYALCNATHGEDEQIALLVANDVLRAVKDMLEMDKKMQAIGLEAIRSIILAGETDADEIGYNPYSKLMDALGVFNSVQSLALDVEHSVAVAEIQDTFIDDWISYKEENPDEVSHPFVISFVTGVSSAQTLNPHVALAPSGGTEVPCGSWRRLPALVYSLRSGIDSVAVFAAVCPGSGDGEGCCEAAGNGPWPQIAEVRRGDEGGEGVS